MQFVVRRITLEEKAKADAVFVEQGDIAQDGAIVKGVTGLVASSAWSSGVKRLVSGKHIDMAVAQAFKAVKARPSGGVEGIILIKANSADCFCQFQCGWRTT